jgi:hypothetical protein
MAKSAFNFKWALLIPVVVLFLVLQGCNIDPNPLGLDTLPKDKLTSYHIDTLAVQAYTIGPTMHYTYYSKSNTPSNTLYPLGLLNDPKLGTTKCDLAFTYTFDELNYSLDGDLVYDTLELALYFKRFYPKEVGPIRIEVFELTRDIKPAHSDYDMSQHFYEDSLLATLTFNPDDEQYKAYLIDDGDSTYLFTKIPLLLPESFGKKFFYDGYGLNFKGFYIRTIDISGNEGVCLVGADTLKLKYHDSSVPDSVDGRDSSVFIHANSLSLYAHDYAGFDYLQEEIVDSSAQEDSVIAIQGLDGLRAYIRIPELNSWIDTTKFVFINSAQLILPIETDDPTYENFDPPRVVGLRLITEDGEANIADEPTRSLLDNYFGGDSIDS